ncbi:helix-turn-helix domain-containing protein [Streptomyces sp. NPDC004111]|uniref:helix-turn-helix domain-containing protein n=1 Tax=Streptomyces sp. NPDC004111 TaxID=3364690 RepID=UPI0036CDE412
MDLLWRIPLLRGAEESCFEERRSPLKGSPGSKPERDRLCRQMRQLGCTKRQIADEMMRRWQFRPRQAWRFASGMTQEEAAGRCCELLGDESAPVSGKRISEYERWPLGGVRPSLRNLSLLGQVYGVRPDDLLDGLDRQNLPAGFLTEAHDRGDLFDLRRTAPQRSSDPPSPAYRTSTDPPTRERPGAHGHLGIRTKPSVPVEEAAILAAAYESSEHAGRAETSNVGPVVLEGLHDQVRRLARQLMSIDALLLFPEMIRARDRIYRILGGHQQPRQTRELYFLAAVVCCLLAEASQSFGLRVAALEQTRAAWAYAELAGHDSIRAWCRSAQSWHAYRDGRPYEAVMLARSGQRYARGNPAAQQRLHSMEGTALALMGDEATAISAFGAATDDRARICSRDDFFDEVGGVFVADAAKQYQNEANGMIVLGRADDAARCARSAIDLYAQEPLEQRDAALEPSARVTLATSALLGGDIETALNDLRPVLELPPQMRSDLVVFKLREFSLHLRPYARRAFTRVAGLQAEIEEFRVPPLPGSML